MFWKEEIRCGLAPRRFPVWGNITLGTHPSRVDLRHTLKDEHKKVGLWGGDVLDRIVLASEPTETKLVLVSGTDLGLNGLPTLSQIYRAAISTDVLGLCQGEVGPQLLRQTSAKSKVGEILIGMKPVICADGYLRIFRIESLDGVWLRSCDGRSNLRHSASRQWVFVEK